MADTSPILLLMLGLLALAQLTVGGLSIYAAAIVARRAGTVRWPWVLLATAATVLPGGVAVLGAGWLARGCKRSVAGGVSAQLAGVAVVGAVVLAATALGPLLRAPAAALGVTDVSELVGRVVRSPLLGIGALLLLPLASLAPTLVLALLGPRRIGAGDEESEVIIRAAKLKKSYDLGRQKLKVLRGVSLSVRRGEFLAILGTSGSGKSTLLHVLGLLDRADTGSVTIEGADSADLTGPQRDRIRCRDIGFVFQFYHLLPELNVVQNVLMPAMAGTGAIGWVGARADARRRALDILDRLGLGDRLNHRPRQLSGGEQQRVAIARGLVNQPRILLADEPTGNLDSNTGREIITLLKKLNAEAGQTIVMVTHDERLARQADRVLHLRDGRLR